MLAPARQRAPVAVARRRAPWQATAPGGPDRPRQPGLALPRPGRAAGRPALAA